MEIGSVWKVAFIVLQIVFTVSLSAFITLLRSLYRDMRTLETKIETDMEIWNRRLGQIERKQDVIEAVTNEKFKSLTDQVSRGFRNVEKNIDELSHRFGKWETKQG